MAKNITSVLWSASNLPSGLSFNTTTGTFSGTATTVGEYTVPVSVKMNYGEDKKDVKISVGGEVYTKVSVIRNKVGDGLDGSFCDWYYNMAKIYNYISNSYRSSGTVDVMAEFEQGAQAYLYQWYFDYSLVPQQLCVKKSSSGNGGTVCLDVKTKGLTLPANTKYTIRLLIVNQSKKHTTR